MRNSDTVAICTLVDVVDIVVVECYSRNNWMKLSLRGTKAHNPFYISLSTYARGGGLNSKYILLKNEGTDSFFLSYPVPDAPALDIFTHQQYTELTAELPALESPIK